MAQSQS